ncbi:MULTISPECIES: polysialyltransferase family glycosyltransferase [Streptomyces]|uniref:Polysialyltransferase family glycosyltransferase n=1 Tax=Streptomyces edwardsiae TaxID=3075527 RepID=A0ABU2Q9P2_9ACTN|nr:MULTISPECIES: polysialyltransferase family glycosyltransferase [unclassified Streptomyces]MDT0399436.1 polysialyltransferase family glycosyltransferase [Streptomyces sp. DSM 41636]MDT0400747.1 polysialyltransferase family glycosyltransferase [Streptomyces sp. DSM 41635]
MAGTTQIFCVSSLYGVATLAAAIESDCFAEAERRVLLVCDVSAVPEAGPAPDAIPGFAPLRDHFDEVLSWNEAIRPFHPAAWTPRAEDVPLLERHLRRLWRLGDDRVELVLESLAVPPALAIAQVFTGAPVHVYADGVRSYGPTRKKLDPLVGTRVRQVLHPDLVPGLTPLVLREFDVPVRVVAADAFRRAVGELAEAGPELPSPGADSALLLGQCLSAQGVLSFGEEEDLYVRMLREAVERGHRTVVFKPHPAAPVRHSRALTGEAERLGVSFRVLDVPVPAEVLYERWRPGVVVGCFSTGLFTASALYGLPVACVGTGRVLERLTPYQHGDRVPAVLAEAVLSGAGGVAGDELDELVGALGFTMQPQILPRLRPVAERYLGRHFGVGTRHWFRRKRLTSLGLPGGIPKRLAFLPRNATARRVVRRARALRKVVRG